MAAGQWTGMSLLQRVIERNFQELISARQEKYAE